jgi:serine/threonine-protein kinase HipA
MSMLIINTVQKLVAQWPHYFKQHGVGDGDLERLKGIIPAPCLSRA